MQEMMSFCEVIMSTESVKKRRHKRREKYKMHKNDTFICKGHFFCVPLHPQGM